MTSTSAALRWLERLGPTWANVWRWVLFAAGVALAVYFLLVRGLVHDAIPAFVIAGLVIGAALTMRVSMAIPLMATPVLFVVTRLGFGGIDLTVSDAALAAAFGTAVLLGTRPFSRELRALLWCNAVYQFATVLTVIVNPYIQNTVEWFHAWLLVSGALVMGWALGSAGYARLALRLMVTAAVVIAIGTFATGAVQYVHGDFVGVYPTWPFAMHKNFAGTVMAFAALIVYINPDWARCAKNPRRALMITLIVAILMTQSRQALIGLMIAIVLVVSRRRLSGHSRAVLLLLIPATWMIISMVNDQIQSQNKFNSVFQRLDWLRELYAYWKHSPIFGHGLRFWYVDPTIHYQPPQGEVEVLVSAGIVGLLGFAIMWVGMIIVLWRMDPVYGTLAATVVISRLVQGQFDLFWVSSQVSIPFVIAGICLGAKAWVERHPPSMVQGAAFPGTFVTTALPLSGLHRASRDRL
ncbi:O-antigen ligase family protein [Microbacterium terrisoli]|jgi:hypothetical protein|uniref:O-antigen ligase family protein n=1 Tax=Microbacterium terrisoli TaxID=3242192 RepID=UPI002804A61B|nr:O-antigen ligase family protein [Microbacterium protaetiae]